MSLANIAAKHSSTCRRISMLFRQQSIHANAPNTTTSMTDVPCYHTAIITTTLVVNESLGIYPTVEGCGVPDHFTKTSLLLIRHRRTDSHSIRLALRYDDLLEFRFVERTVPFITVRIDQTIHGWVGSVPVNNRKQFFCPVRHVSIFEVSFRFAYAYSIADSELRCADAFVTIQSLPQGFLIGTGYF